MSEEAAKILSERLAEKSILFVDDQRTTVGNYVARLRDLDLRCELIFTLDNAFNRINQVGIGLVILDLFMPQPRSPQLIQYWQKINLTATARNQGRALGYYLWKHRGTKQLPYCYFTAYPAGYGATTDEFNGEPDPYLLNKAAILPSRFAAELVKVLREWDKIANLTSPAGGTR